MTTKSRRDLSRFTLFLAGMALFLVGCATPSVVPDAFVGAAAKHDYIIGPGDSLSINVWRNPEVSTAVQVRPDGKITTPLVEDIVASGKTPTALARDVEKALSVFIQQPVVTVMVTSFVGPYSEQIRVIGQAAKPQALPYRHGMSLLDVMIAVGGMTEFAAGNRATIVRTVEGKREALRVRLSDLIKDGDISVDMPVRPGDVLVIPESLF